MAKTNSDVDADLQDLLGSSPGNDPRILTSSSGTTNGGGTRTEIEMAPLNLDSLAEGKLDVPVKRRHTDATALDLAIAYCTYLCDYAPRCCFLLGIVALIMPGYFVATAIFNPTEEFGVIGNDYNAYADIRSRYDFDLSTIDHWCLKGGDDGCRCEDPLEPQSRGEYRSWTKAHEANVNAVNEIVESGKPIDVAFVGESIVEQMDGRWMGDKENDNLKKLGKLFRKHFQKEGGGVQGVALGVAGDTNPSVLWRLKNGEMPTAFDPKVWWLQLGLNDIGRMQCSEEVVVLGILRIVEEILASKPSARVVINSLLPMPMLRGGIEVKKSDFKDSFSNAATDRLRAPLPAQTAARPTQTKEATDDGGSDGDSAKVDKQKKKGKKKKGGKNLRQLKIQSRDDSKRPSKTHGGRTRAKPEAARSGVFSRNRVSPVMSSNTYKQKKFTPVTHRERRLPLWTAITTVNEELQKFVKKNERVSFFDATPIFAEEVERGEWVLKTHMISMRGHPTEAGYQEWERQIVDHVKGMTGGSE